MRLLRRIMGILVSNPLGTAVARRVLPPLDRVIFTISRGRFTFVGLIEPALVLETVGAQSGQPRQNPLLYVRDAGRFVVAGTNFGQAAHPAWTANLLAHPEATIRLNGKSLTVSAEPVTEPEERARLWAALDTVYAGYRRYREVTAGIREVRMFALTPQRGNP